ncbi:LLM class flavin-dependent oxidoreductase [Nocardiopsis aegyptia]|uniref:FAD/FMN-containing dehydrogenase n=1 Tax=Nocardiopsis aegyptia TaxID=220378 RepID=A0A7Z0JDM3_9ACTN|nr:LLM class flavin-dependent oxidoreductase [Nocardiopsis aegyptia]NYJ37639.1 FAD/FMN-containing dehydrogenase [Nocardiopsis aegyptia]
MPDYGHALEFGTFVTPSAQDPERAVTLAALTESAGLDLVGFQDHPYNPALLDTWTLLSWVAARTTRLRLTGNVLNLPLRPPAMLARAAAGLDLLSGGRVELALGAGAFWDAIEAMGTPRRTPREAVDALGEAIDLIRMVWDTEGRGGVRLDGEHYSAHGMKRGPAPAHDIGISLGAYKPRMLRLVGAKADGWLPSLSYMDTADLPAAHRTIDEAAVDAGRDPRRIRRGLNIQGAILPTGRAFLQGPAEQWVDDLLPLVLEHGFATFHLASDDPRAIQAFGAEVAPALREAVERERGSAGTATGPVRSTAALAARHPGIDYDAVPEGLRSTAVEPGDRSYARVRHTYIHPGRPGLVLRPTTPEEVARALAYARAQDAPLAVRSGGHGISGRSTNDGGVVIDLGAMDRVEVLDPASGRVRADAGARWARVARTLEPHGLALSSGDYGGVGVGGLATAGGIGYMSRGQGLTLDNVTAAEVVTADGRLLRADATENPDLFWALRGAGGNFGIVTSVELSAHPVDAVVFARLVYDAADTPALLRAWGEVQEAAPREATGFLYVAPARQGQGPMAQAMIVHAAAGTGGEVDTERAAAALEPFLTVAPVLDQQASLAPYSAILPVADAAHSGAGGGAFRSGLMEHVTPRAAEGLADLLDSGHAMLLQLRSVGGAVNDVPADATAYAHRTQNFSVSAVGSKRRVGSLDGRWEELGADMEGLYLNFETRTGPEVLAQAFPEPALSRLRALKAEYDPENVFSQNFPIEPAAGGR